MNEKIDEIKKSLYELKKKGSRKDFKFLAEAYEDEILAMDSISDKCIKFIVGVLSDELLIAKDGVSIFIVKCLSDIFRFSDAQKSEILSAVCDNYWRYTDEKLCWNLGDVIARNYSRDVAIDAFRNIYNRAGLNGKKGVALGLGVLRMQCGNDDRILSEISSILQND
jgi:hypothetical protein